MSKYTHWTKRPDAEEIRQRIKQNLKGRKAWNKGKKGVQQNPLKGKKMPKEWAAKAAEGRKGKCGGWNKGMVGISGKEHYAWKGNDVGIKALHQWVKRKKGRPMKCEFCGIVVDSYYKIHWANKSGKYKRDLDDWIRLCVPCHKSYDLKRLHK